jgi:hypothetical protein
LDVCYAPNNGAKADLAGGPGWVKLRRTQSE